MKFRGRKLAFRSGEKLGFSGNQPVVRRSHSKGGLVLAEEVEAAKNRPTKWGGLKNCFGTTLGIRTQIFAGFAIFTVIIVVLLWVFQITLLNTFYKAIKQNEIKNTAKYVAEIMEQEDFVEDLATVIQNTGIDVMITSARGENIISMAMMRSDLFESLTPLLCYQIYEETKASGGEFMRSYTPWAADKGFRGEAFGRKQTAAEEEIIYLKTVEAQNGQDRLLILNTRVTPVDSTVDTLKVQLWCLTGVMILLSGLLALFLSRKISRPITAISSGAKLLGLGRYDVNFEGHGSRETRELADTLNYTARELSKVEGLRRELIANVSHDLRTPLTMISGYAEVMRDIPGENSPENVQVIMDEAERLKNLVNDLLDLSKLEAGKMELSLSRVNLTGSIREILRRYDKLADYSFDFYHGEDVYVMGDEIKLSQVVYNLVNNAITYTGPDQHVVLTQSLTKLPDGSDAVKIEITDSGEGIPEDKLKDIWERYYKVEKDHKRSKVGTGLGLSIVKNVLELHGGSYGVTSAVGQGSTFWFQLKAAE